MKLILIIPIVFVLLEWAYLILPERLQCRKCLSFWLSIPLLWVPQEWLELAVIPSTISIIIYSVDKYSTFFEKTFKL